MKPHWDELVKKVDQAETAWASILPTLPELLQIPQVPNNVPKEAITQGIAEISGLLKTLSDREDIDPLMYAVHTNGVNQIAQLPNYVQAVRSGPQQVMQLVNCLWGAKSSLVWLLPPGVDQLLADAIKKEVRAGKFASAKKSFDEVHAVSLQAKDAATEISRRMEEIKGLTEQIKNSDKDVSMARTSAQASATNAAADQQKIGEALKKLEDGITANKQLSEDIAKLRKDVDETLEGASKVGLARSFSNRREELVNARRAWGVWFAVGIALLVAVPSWGYGYFRILLPPNTPVQWELAFRVLIETPIVWFTWWAVRQFGHTTRLAEDYAFKEATALAFVGYRKEMGGDNDMLKLLQESAIKNFGNNPVRVLGESDPSTPGHELVEKIIDKIPAPQFGEFLKALFSKK